MSFQIITEVYDRKMNLQNFGFKINIPKMPEMKGKDPLWIESQSLSDRHLTHFKELNEESKMANLYETAQEYEPVQTKNIADLEKVSVKDVDVVTKTFKGKDGEFTIDVITVDGEDYRVPASVLKSLKELIAEKPDLKDIKVKKSGSGLQTSYTVIPL
jgi:CO dehydrogenase/acetyl-CoA synthase epsilon subunit